MTDLTRRGFLKATVIIGGALAGCTRLTPEDEAIPAATLPPGLSFIVQDDAVDYGPYAEGCATYAIGGSVRDAQGDGLAGVPVQIAYDVSTTPTTLRTAADGTFLVEVAGDMQAGGTYYVQVLRPEGQAASEIVTVEAIPDCALNHMTVNFVPG